MTFSRFSRPALAILAAAALLSPGMASAHEGHKDNMSDAEMVRMEMHEDTAMHNGSAEAMHEPSAMEQAHRAAESAAKEETAEQALEAKIEENRVTSAGDFLGRVHPITAHFPIALLLMAAFAEIMLARRPSLALEASVRLLVAGGATGALAAALLGWFAAGWRLQDRSETLGIHRWNGTAIAGVALVASWLAFRSGNRALLRILLAALAAALVLQGYLGGEMVFGPNHLGIL